MTIDTEKPDAINIISQELDVETGATEKLSVEQTEDSLEVVQVFENGDPQSLSVFTYDVAQQDRPISGSIPKFRMEAALLWLQKMRRVINRPHWFSWIPKRTAPAIWLITSCQILILT